MKKIIAVLTVLVTLAVAIPTFAAGKMIKCGGCYGSGWVPCPPNIPAFNYRRDEKGRKVRVPPYQRPCFKCRGTGRIKCSSCGGRGEKYIQVSP